MTPPGDSSRLYNPITPREDEKAYPYTHTTAYAAPQNAFDVDDVVRSQEALRAKDLKYKRSIQYLRFATRFSSTILSGYIIGSLCYSLAKYFLTRDHLINGTVHPWSTPTVLWPTYMLLSIAIITFWLNVITLIAYVCSVEAANKTDSVAGYIGYAITGVHFVVWAVATGLYKMASKDARDLWGYSCGDVADEIQSQVQSYLNFGTLCTVQTGAWYSTIIEVVSYFLTFVTIALVLRRNSHKKKLLQYDSVMY